MGKIRIAKIKGKVRKSQVKNCPVCGKFMSNGKKK